MTELITKTVGSIFILNVSNANALTLKICKWQWARFAAGFSSGFKENIGGDRETPAKAQKMHTIEIGSQTESPHKTPAFSIGLLPRKNSGGARNAPRRLPATGSSFYHPEPQGVKADHAVMALWVDKYRPSSLDKLHYHNDLSIHLKKLVSQSPVGRQ